MGKKLAHPQTPLCTSVKIPVINAVQLIMGVNEVRLKYYGYCIG